MWTGVQTVAVQAELAGVPLLGTPHTLQMGHNIARALVRSIVKKEASFCAYIALYPICCVSQGRRQGRADLHFCPVQDFQSYPVKNAELLMVV